VSGYSDASGGMKRLQLQGMRIVRETRLRRCAYIILGVILALLCIWPRPYVARAKILPQDPSSAGVSAVLNSLGGQLQSFASLLSGGKPPNDLYLIIGRSDSVAADVINRLKLVGPAARYSTPEDAKVALARKVDVHLLLGGVVEVETTTHDADESMKLTDAYIGAISKKIGTLGLQNIVRKREIIQDRFAQATKRVAKAEADLDDFRRRNHLADPEAQLGSELTLRVRLQAGLQAKLIELQTMQQFQGGENPQLVALQSEVASLRGQLANSAQPSVGTTGPNVAGFSELTTQYMNLYRDFRFTQAIYEVYARSAEQVSVEEMVASNASYVQIIEPNHLDPWRHYNITAVALLIMLLLVAAFTEIYAPATGLFNPSSSSPPLN
jgi:hypothetical protein